MKIKIEAGLEDKPVLEGEFSYTENLTESSEKPSFLISSVGKTKDFDISFYFENEEELNELIKNLEDLKKQ